MNSLQHQKEVLRCRGPLKIAINESNEDLLHAALGASTEAGELLDQVKKHLFYGKKLDVVNLQEEIGDICWYLNLLCNYLGTTLEEQMENNAEKLRIRYPEGFKQEKALERNVENELKHYEPLPLNMKACVVCQSEPCIC